MVQWDLDNAGPGHHVVAIVGSQSSGKSTLLNKLFGTSFNEMDPKKRCQTTKGIWMSRSERMSALVLDVEGADGCERGEDTGFEHKSTLFAFAISDAIILNLWQHQVGLRKGANLELFETVFEVNLQLFRDSIAKQKTLLMIIIRDHDGDTPLENLKTTLETNFEQIWAKLPKPRSLENCEIHDCFDIEYIGLPSIKYASAQFGTEVAKLRDRFIDRNHGNYVFCPEYFKCSTTDEYDEHLFNIWELIRANEDLDLATKRESVAARKCEEISKTAFAEFKQNIQDLQTWLENDEIIYDQGEQLQSHLDDAMRTFDEKASYYDQRVYQTKQNELFEKINTERQRFFGLHLKNLRRKAINKFNEDMEDKLSEASYDFNKVLDACFTEHDNYFKDYSKVVGLYATDILYEKQYNGFKEDLNKEKQKHKREGERREREKKARLEQEERLRQAKREQEEQLRQAKREQEERLRQAKREQEEQLRQVKREQEEREKKAKREQDERDRKAKEKYEEEMKRIKEEMVRIQENAKKQENENENENEQEKDVSIFEKVVAGTAAVAVGVITENPVLAAAVFKKLLS
ncbi:Dynamin-like GTPase that mediates homotypic ER fusion [Apophysomyces ossiformis]|uniref:Dynamin-like GTPase that mediates homotypic ER fusion n=1 Tax=Apophysomyces ossiformis TaxID=679940 RepID=A0A8H7ERB0_9FUNG|nr:Dynamin-like GTPase that mediates homotypic ER fusion [Apophysomyces ossiformis]